MALGEIETVNNDESVDADISRVGTATRRTSDGASPHRSRIGRVQLGQILAEDRWPTTIQRFTSPPA